QSGEVAIASRTITHLAPEQRNITMVFQSYALWPHLTVQQNLIEAPCRVLGLSKDQALARAEKLLERLRLKPYSDRYPLHLSGGQQQQLAIGRALASRPQLLILDEPTEGIQPSVIKEIGEVIRQLASRGDMAILLVEQFYDFAAGLADHYLVMSRGAIV
ncbi:ATP-binding cassette domain-containing protein, partial [Pseudomonas aeruginosa]|nr:ATP-binding cassette domain-containing protein [Pseudomonas aeruginosa]